MDFTPDYSSKRFLYCIAIYIISEKKADGKNIHKFFVNGPKRHTVDSKTTPVALELGSVHLSHRCYWFYSVIGE